MNFIKNILPGFFYKIVFGMLFPLAANAGIGRFESDSLPGARKMKDIVIDQDPAFYSSFPSIIKRPKGEFVLAFRRAPERRGFGEKATNHVDPNSYLVAVRSRDGESWTKEPGLIYAHTFGGSQDPCLLQLKNGDILCTSYGWAFPRADGMANLKKPYFESGGAVFLGGYLLRSTDGAKTWTGPPVPTPCTPRNKFHPTRKSRSSL